MAKVYLISGGTSDIGVKLLEILLSAAKADDRFIVQGHSNLAALKDLSGQYASQIDSYAVDLSDRAAVTQFLDTIELKYGALTHYAHMPAMRMVYKDFADFDEEYFARDFQVQVGSAIAICKRFVPKMAQNKFGRVVFMLSSIIIGIPPQHCAAYSMLKHTIHGMMKSLAADYAADGVTLNAVAPSMVQTKFIVDVPPDVVEAAVDSNPMKRNAVPADIAPAMAFLLSEGAGYITGVTVPVSGGLVI